MKTAVALSLGQDFAAPHGAAGGDGDGGSVVAMTPAPDAIMQALVYIPPAVEAVVRRIQRVWRVRMLRRRRELRKAAVKMQAAYRGNRARKHLREARDARTKGKQGTVTGLWWITAHQTPRAKSDEEERAMAAQLRAETAKMTKEEAIKRWVDMGKTKEEAEAEYAEAERRRKRKRKRDMRRKGLAPGGKPKGLPRWFIYVIYVGTFLFVMAASYFIMLNGLIFEPAVSRAWLLSSAFALFMELCVQDPVKISAAAAATFYVKDAKRKREEEAARQDEEEAAAAARMFEKARKDTKNERQGSPVLGVPVNAPGGVAPPPPVHMPDVKR